MTATQEASCDEHTAGVAGAIGELVDWGKDEVDALGLELNLEHIDIALPTDLLSDPWQPEEIEYHRRLGDEFLVTVRWADRLHPSLDMRRSINSAVRRLRDIASSPRQPPIDVLDEHHLQDPARLKQRLVDGTYRHAIGLVRRPVAATEALELLLTYSPIVLWPRLTADFPAHRWNCVAAQWSRLPEAFPLLYRNLGHGEATDETAQLRAIWDDEGWLKFCRRFQRAEDKS